MHPLSDLKIIIGQKDVPQGYEPFTAYRFKLKLTIGLLRPLAPSIEVTANVPGEIVGGAPNVAAHMLDDGRLLVAADRHGLPSGPLWATLTVYYPDADMPDGERAQVSEWDTGVVLDRYGGDTVAETQVSPLVVYRTAYDLAVAHGFTGTAEEYQAALKAVGAGNKCKPPLNPFVCRGVISTSSIPGNVYVNYGMVRIDQSQIVRHDDTAIEILRERIDLMASPADKDVGDGFSIIGFFLRGDKVDDRMIDTFETTGSTYVIPLASPIQFASDIPCVFARLNISQKGKNRITLRSNGHLLVGSSKELSRPKAVVDPPALHLVCHAVINYDDIKERRLFLRSEGIQAQTLVRHTSIWETQRKLCWRNTPRIKEFNPYIPVPQHRFIRARYNCINKISDWAYFEIERRNSEDEQIETWRQLQNEPPIVTPWREHKDDVRIDVAYSINLKSGYMPSASWEILRESVMSKVNTCYREMELRFETDEEIIDDNLTGTIILNRDGNDDPILDAGDILYMPDAEARGSDGSSNGGYYCLVSSARAFSSMAQKVETIPLNNFSRKGKTEVPDMPKGTKVWLVGRGGCILENMKRHEAREIYERMRDGWDELPLRFLRHQPEQ